MRKKWYHHSSHNTAQPRKMHNHVQSQKSSGKVETPSQQSTLMFWTPPGFTPRIWVLQFHLKLQDKSTIHSKPQRFDWVCPSTNVGRVPGPHGWTLSLNTLLLFIVMLLTFFNPEWCSHGLLFYRTFVLIPVCESASFLSSFFFQ